MRDGAHLAVAATHATGASVCRQPEPSLRAQFQPPPPPRASRQIPTVLVASIASVVSPTARRAPVNDRCTRYGCLADGFHRPASRGGPPQSVNVVSGLSRTATRGPIEVCREEVLKPLLDRVPTPGLSTLTTHGLMDSPTPDSTCTRSWLRRSRRWCRPPLTALRSTTAAQDTAASQTDSTGRWRGGPPQSVNVVSGLSRTATRGPVEVCREEVLNRF